jgi:hypothetical protein
MTVSSGGVTPQEPEITEEMIEAGARSLADTIDPSMRVPNYLRGYARGVLAAALAGRTVAEAPGQADLSAFDPSELNSLAATMTELRGYIPLNVRFGASAAALAYLDQHDPASRDPLTNNDDGTDEYARAVAESQSDARRLASESRKDGETHD